MYRHRAVAEEAAVDPGVGIAAGAAEAATEKKREAATGGAGTRLIQPVPNPAVGPL